MGEADLLFSSSVLPCIFLDVVFAHIYSVCIIHKSLLKCKHTHVYFFVMLKRLWTSEKVCYFLHTRIYMLPAVLILNEY